MKTKKAAKRSKIPARKLPKSDKLAVKAAVKRKRPRHKRILLHPISVMVLLCVGVFIAGLTYRAVASDITVTAKVPAPALTEGAIITSPASGQTFTSVPITVSGTCPNNSYVSLYLNSSFSGSAWCNSNAFSIETTLSAGANTIQAQDYNITDDPGPVTPTISANYSPPASSPGTVPHTSSATSSPSTTSPRQTTLPLVLSTDYTFHTFLVNSNFSWALQLLGGTQPFTVLMDWGDGNTSTLALPTDEQFTISHQYKSPGYFPVKIKATDARGISTYLQLAALIKLPGTVGFTTQSQPPLSDHEQTSGHHPFPYLGATVVTYTVATLMVFSFWLGEREEITRLARARYMRRRHP